MSRDPILRRLIDEWTGTAIDVRDQLRAGAPKLAQELDDLARGTTKPERVWVVEAFHMQKGGWITVSDEFQRETDAKAAAAGYGLRTGLKIRVTAFQIPIAGPL